MAKGRTVMVTTNKLPSAVLRSHSSVLPVKDAREFAQAIVSQESGGDKFVKGTPKLLNPAATAGSVQRSILARAKRSLAKDMVEAYDSLPAHLRPKLLAKLTNKALDNTSTNFSTKPVHGTVKS